MIRVMEYEPVQPHFYTPLIHCEWCGQRGIPSSFRGLVNGDRQILICTECANHNVTHESAKTGTIFFTETGIEREEREARIARS